MTLRPIARSEEELLRLVIEHNGTVTGVMTPECAGWLLRLNTGNRPLLDSDIRKFEGILARGEWVNTGEPIIVSSEGVLNDGQHRLEAIFRACRSAEVDVRFGIPRAAFASTGGGRVRSAADVFGIMGETNTKRLVSVLRLVDGYRRGGLFRLETMKLTPVQMIALAEKHPTARAVASKLSGYRTKGCATAPFGALLVLAAEETDLGTAINFADLVESGASDRGDGARELRERMLRDAAEKGVVSQNDRLILGIKAWNAWLGGREVRLLKVVETDRTTQGFPRVLGNKKPRFRVAAA